MVKTGNKVLVLSYWPLDDVLTQGAILPHLKLLQQVKSISEITLVTVECKSANRNQSTLPSSLPGIKHVPLRNQNSKLKFLNKVIDFIVLPKLLQQIVVQENVDAILASGTLSGTLAYKVWLKYKTPFYVLYEPHSAYMLDTNVWRKTDLRYIFQRKWEKKQLQAANGLLVVSENYEQFLLQQGKANADKIRLCPNPVYISGFRFDQQKRSEIRSKLNWQAATIGIYVGKYGGLYYNDEAFKLYKLCFRVIPDFRLIILSPQPIEEITAQLQKYKINRDKVFITAVAHSEVSSYLSAADFAFATIKSYPSARFCCPVKIGEYWANGLPVLLTEGVGDESEIIKKEGGGAVFNLQEKGSIEKAIQKIQVILSDSTHRQRIPELAAKYRSPEKVREVYEYFFNQQHNI